MPPGHGTRKQMRLGCDRAGRHVQRTTEQAPYHGRLDAGRMGNRLAPHVDCPRQAPAAVVSEDVSPYNRAHEEVGREQPPWTCRASTRPRPPSPRAFATSPTRQRRLWVRGDACALARTAVAIVGSRRASPGSLDIAHRLASDLARIGLTIVSGLARGCDGAAHRGALEAGGITIAVLGSGLDVIYPPEHDALAEQIARQGALLSEFPPGAPPLPHHFRQRNRLISGLAHGVIVIEANDKSGSLITAGCALAQGREVMVVPGTVLAGRNRGGHQLIRDGAALVENAEDVLACSECGPTVPAREREPSRALLASESERASRRRRSARRRPSAPKAPSPRGPRPGRARPRRAAGFRRARAANRRVRAAVAGAAGRAGIVRPDCPISRGTVRALFGEGDNVASGPTPGQARAVDQKLLWLNHL